MYDKIHYKKKKQKIQNYNFFDMQSIHEAPIYPAFSPFLFASNAEWPSDGWHWVLQPFLVQLQEINLDDCYQLVIVNFWWPATARLSSKV